MQQSTGSFARVAVTGSEEPRQLGTVEAGFVQSWAGLAQAFGMDSMLGRVHALAFLSPESLSATEVALALKLSTDQAADYLDSLTRWGAVREVGSDGDEPRFEADGDPWSWFLVTLKERGRREFAPLVQSIRDANRHAQELRTTLEPGASEDLHRIARIARFSDFVEQIAGLLESFASVGAGPVMSALRMMAKVRSPRVSRFARA
jgi:DNA-binding transcriptional regulator GbsR (MarR family)